MRIFLQIKLRRNFKKLHKFKRFFLLIFFKETIKIIVVDFKILRYLLFSVNKIAY